VTVGVGLTTAVGVVLVYEADPTLIEAFGATAAAQVLNFHIAFNALTAALFLPLIGPLAELTIRLLQAPEVAPEQALRSARIRGVPRIVLLTGTFCRLESIGLFARAPCLALRSQVSLCACKDSYRNMLPEQPRESPQRL